MLACLVQLFLNNIFLKHFSYILEKKPTKNPNNSTILICYRIYKLKDGDEIRILIEKKSHENRKVF